MCLSDVKRCRWLLSVHVCLLACLEMSSLFWRYLPCCYYCAESETNIFMLEESPPPCHYYAGSETNVMSACLKKAPPPCHYYAESETNVMSACLKKAPPPVIIMLRVRLRDLDCGCSLQQVLGRYPHHLRGGLCPHLAAAHHLAAGASVRSAQEKTSTPKRAFTHHSVT